MSTIAILLCALTIAGPSGRVAAAPTWPQSAIPAGRRSRWLESARGVKGQLLRRPRWFVRDEMKFMELKTKLDPALDDLCDDCTAEFAMFAAETKKMFKVIPRSHHDRFDIELQSKLSESYVVPSSGLMAIGYALEEVSKSGDEKLSSQVRPPVMGRSLLQCRANADRPLYRGRQPTKTDGLPHSRTLSSIKWPKTKRMIW